MIKDYIFSTTPKIESYITQINTYRDLFSKLSKEPQVQENLLHRSTLKSALYSARIEGNPLDLSDMESNFVRREEKKEIFQIYEAMKFAYSFRGEATPELFLNLHKIALAGLTSEAGRFRSAPSAIYNNAGIAVYIAPPAQNVGELVSELIDYINIDKFEICRAACAYFAFEKIHPFLDGNSCVGRVLLNWYLARLGYEFIWFSSFEEYIEKNRADYYSALSIQNNDITEFVEFILDVIAQSSEKTILDQQAQKEEKIEDFLLPRRAEILAIVREHKMVTFDQIRRRFMLISARSLHNDLQDLARRGLIRKLGITRSAVYVSK